VVSNVNWLVLEAELSSATTLSARACGPVVELRDFTTALTEKTDTSVSKVKNAALMKTEAAMNGSW
jgi:transcriptional regulator of acetoin/glycerol metabolism